MMKNGCFKALFLIFFSYQFIYADAILLNEYNAVKPDAQPRNDGYDTYFGDIDGNGGDWIELVVVEDHLDLRGATLKIKSGSTSFLTATFPYLTEFAYLRKGTIVTVSELPTDTSYSPMDENNPDWTINLNASELENQNGSFRITSGAMDISIDSMFGDILMQNSGEIVLGWGISNDEVFKLKKDPSASIQPDDPAYGDDKGKQIISTFGSLNQWIDSDDVTIHQNFDTLRDINSSINMALLLNEYDAVDQDKKLKKDGSDSYFGQVDGNGGSWVEVAILKDKTDLRKAEIRVFGKYNSNNFKATFPNIEVLSQLRSGTILTISDEVATDLSYDPFNPSAPDWNINIHTNDLTTLEGKLLTDNLKLILSIRSGSGGVTIMPESGEGVRDSCTDDKEIFKLKRDPSLAIMPDDSSAYGDDRNKKAVSTFGAENRWKNRKQDFSTLRAMAMENNLYGRETSLILNEYNAVASNKYLKHSGMDSYFGSVAGNGGSWLEMVVTRDYLNLQNSTIKIRENGIETFSAQIPELISLAYLRKGTMLTISDEPTNMDYTPFAPNSDGWKLNLNIGELVNPIGSFTLNDNNIDISIDKNGTNILLDRSGELISNPVVDNQEVYKLKAEPSKDITPFDSKYGDDSDDVVISTFASANQWIDVNGTLQTQKLTVRKNSDLNETDGIVTANVDGMRLKDGESILYVPQNNSLWIADDSSHKVYEMDLTTKEIKTVFRDEDLGFFAPDIQDSCENNIGACDVESVAYDENNDTLYIFVGSASSTPAIFKLTRDDINASFTLNDYRKLDGIEYPATQFIEGNFIVTQNRSLYIYDFETNSIADEPIYTIPGAGGVVGLAYANNTLWATTANFELLKINWETKALEGTYNMNDNGIFDPRGIEIINNRLYILDGINRVGKIVSIPQGHPLKGAIHIYETP
ncbi:hypothetical protein GSY74_05120, partial [Sulfurovum sp. bin170]|uniref:hypothetical protein n=1 Tax=Sulfurovum sp. bin170 TaxID=2695268 RepID=UPI0013DF01AA